MPVRIKICGITRPADAELAAALGADAVGLVFAPGSPRRVEAAQALAICRALPPLVCTVGLFMDQSPDEVEQILERIPLGCLQFHGRESAEYCRSFHRPYIKVVPMVGPGAGNFRDHPEAAALLLDGHAAGEAGGSGRSFDWASAQVPDRPWILAGGLTPGNVAEALRLLGPPAVDVSSGVEDAPGVKSDKLMRQFVEVIRNG